MVDSVSYILQRVVIQLIGLHEWPITFPSMIDEHYKGYSITSLEPDLSSLIHQFIPMIMIAEAVMIQDEIGMVDLARPALLEDAAALGALGVVDVSEGRLVPVLVSARAESMTDPRESVSTGPHTGVTVGKIWSGNGVSPVHVAKVNVWPRVQAVE